MGTLIHIASEKVKKNAAYLENSWIVPQKVTNWVIIWPSNSTLRYIPKIIENICLNKKMYTNVYSSSIHNSRKMESTQMSINKWMDKQNMVWSYNGILFSHKKWSTDSCYNMDEPWKPYARWKKQDSKGYMLHDCIYIKYSE